MHHIELIEPNEKLSPSLGGSGYLPPSVPVTVSGLIGDCLKSLIRTPELNTSVWKVIRVRRSDAPPRRLTLPNGRYLHCSTLGGQGSMKDGWYYWLVAVNATDALYALGVESVELVQPAAERES